MMKLNDSLEFIQKTSMSKRKESEDFLQVLREWALIEEFYSKGLQRITDYSVFNQAENNFLENIKSHVIFISKQSQELSDKLNGYIIIHFKELLTTQSHSVKNNYIEGKVLGENMTKKYKIALESMNKYFSSCKDCEQIAFDLDKETSQVKKEKIHQKMLLIKKDIDINYTNYTEAVRSFNLATPKYKKSIHKVIDAYNFYEEKRCKVLEESLKILHKVLFGDKIPFDFSVKPYIYDLSGFSIEELEIEAYEGEHPLFQCFVSSPYLHYSLLESSGSSNGTHTAVEELFKSEIGEIVSKAWIGEDLTSDDYVKFNMRIKDPLGRKAWSWSMNLRRAQGNFKLNETGYSKIGELMMAALNECERTQDTYIAKNCIILSQTFYKESGKNQKNYLQNFIIGHSIWKNMEFWEGAINSAIFEELKKQGGFLKEGSEDFIKHEKILVFSQLVSFGHIMMSFKIHSGTAKLLVNKYAEKYQFSQEETENIMMEVNHSLQNNKE